MATAELPIRPAVLEDWDALFPLLQSMGLSDGDVEEPHQRFADLIHDDGHYIPVAIDGLCLIGYGWVQDFGPHLRSGNRTARLHDLFVDVVGDRQALPGASLVTPPTVNSLQAMELAEVAERGGSFHWLSDEPDLYSLNDGEPV